MRAATLLVPSAPATLPLDQIHLNDNNPRILKEQRFEQLVKSLQDFPEMLSLRPLVIDETGVVLGGNMRTRALQHMKGLPENEKQGRIEHAVFHRGLVLDKMGKVVADATPEQKEAYRAALTPLYYDTTVPVTFALNLTPAQKREFIIKDNASFGEWDWEALGNGEWGDAATLNGWGLQVPKDWDHEPEILDEVALPSGEAPAFKQMTFTLTADQAYTVETALGIIKTENDITVFEATGNENKNGNALAHLCEQFNSQHNTDAADDTDEPF